MSRYLKRCNFSVPIFSLMVASIAYAGDVNTTGIPTYPHIDTDATMDAIYRLLPNGQSCLHYMVNSPDALAAVEAWYRKQLPNAKEEDVNHESLYSGFELDGIKLLVANDLVNIYRTKTQQDTSIEIFKCKNAAHS